MSLEDEIKQGLRTETGALIGGLNVEEYTQGYCDFEDGTPPPKFTTTSYDLGRSRASERAQITADFWDWQKRDSERRESMMTDILKDRPDLLAEYLAKMASLSPTPAPKP